MAKAYNDLKREGLTGGDAYQGAAARADQILQTHFMKPLMEMAYPPMGYVTFKGLHKPGGQCVELTRQTVDALGHDQNLQMMFVLASHYDLEVRLMVLVKQLQMNGTDEAIIRATIAYFPHL
ncbi:hypothetical protein FRB93_004730 [Tulasnella sp. JGI-2019a]|nr:hypothetical protein FRB93_004730 [Tulasnella sp. JGI-2019a]